MNVIGGPAGMNATAAPTPGTVPRSPVHDPTATAGLPRLDGSAKLTLTDWLATPLTLNRPPFLAATTLLEVGGAGDRERGNHAGARRQAAGRLRGAGGRRQEQQQQGEQCTARPQGMSPTAAHEQEEQSGQL